MKNLIKYGDMFRELAEKINDDIKTKTDEELIEIGNEAKSVVITNCSWSEYRVSYTVMEYVVEEKLDRELGGKK
jgi:hypothetical protein